MTVITARQELEELSELYRVADEKEKEAAEVKKELRPAIMSLISEVVRDEVPLARKTVKLSIQEFADDFSNDPEVWRKRLWPAWNIVGMSGDDKNVIFEIEENDAFVKFEFFVNGYKFGRTVATKPVSIDLDKLLTDPKAEEYGISEIVDEIVTYKLNEERASRFFHQHPDSKKLFDKYVVPGELSPRLLQFTPQEEEQ